MSASEIADNKWELTSAKPPVVTVSGLSQIVMMIGFTIFFGYMLAFSLIGAFGPKREGGLEQQYKAMSERGAAAAPANP
jgi:hypothetical protein